MSDPNHPYFEKNIAFATKHQKDSLLAPVTKRLLNANLFLAEVDTDLFGTFSGEVQRTLSPLQTAIAKARMGMAYLDYSLGMASEGTIGPDPLLPFISVDIETLVFIDDERNLVISETEKFSNIVAARIVADVNTRLDSFLDKADFPNHHLIVREDKNEAISHVIKGISTINQLTEAIVEIASISEEGKVVIESDFRSHCSPSRRKNISILGNKLVSRLAATCPSCQQPGWGKIDYLRGLNCSDCGTFLANALHQKLKLCVSCEYKEYLEVVANEVNPANCLECNP